MRQRAVAQHGLVGRDELRAAGVSRQAVANRLRSPDWEAVTRRVLRLVGTAASGRQGAMAAVLDAGDGAVVSHGAAAALWGLPGFDLGAIHVSRRRGGSGRPTPLATVHHPERLTTTHCDSRHGIPTTGLARTVVDLAATEHPARVELAAHAAVRLGVTWSALEQVLDEVGARGRPGTAVARSVIEGGHGRRPLGSGLEGRFLRLLRLAGLPEPRRQVDLGAGDWVGRVDFLYDDVRLVIEVDGGWHHEGALDIRRDKPRSAALVAAGFRVLPVAEDLLRRDPAEVVRLVSDARRRARRPTG
jgi:very-short-patch-repair endonuclease